MRRRSAGGARPRARGYARNRRGAFRQEIVRLHLEIFRRNQRRINESVSGYTQAFRRYEREYARGVKTYQQRTTFSQLDKAVSRSNVVYVGDYHTLRQAQRSFLRLLRRLPPDRPVTVALEFIQGRHQRVVDAFMAGEISAEEFLTGIDHEEHWVFGGYQSFLDILELARERGHRVLAIDTIGKGPAGASLTTRDAYAARRIARTLRERPERLVMVLIGELHVSPAHLPRRVHKELDKGDRKIRDLVIYQNCEEVYWELERRGLEHTVEIVRMTPREYCVMNTPPIVCQQSFLNWLDLDEEGQQLEAPEQNFKEYAQLVASFFDLDIGEALDEVEVTTVVDLSFLQRLKKRGDFNDADMRTIRKQIVNSESYYIPGARMAYLGNLSVNHAAEEATHFVRHVCANAQDPKLLVDAFYARALEEAIGFLGSKLINHKRKATTNDIFRRLARNRRATKEERHLARLVLKHERIQNGERVRGTAEVYESNADAFNAITHIIGYQLGDRLYYGLISGEIQKSEIRELFHDTFEEEGEAITTYLYLMARTANVALPDRI